MKVIEKEVLLLKSQDVEAQKSSKNYESALTARNFSVKIMKVIDFEFKNLSKLKEQLMNPDEYSGIIFTSPRSIQAAKLAMGEQQAFEKWSKKFNFTVGETSKNLISDLLNIDSAGSETGNAANLSKLIIENKHKYTQPFLFPCGNLKKDTLPTELAKENIHLNSITVYDTIQNTELNNLFDEYTKNGTEVAEFFVYFSPSGVKYTKDILERLNLINFIKFIAIGPSTAEEIIKNDWSLYGTAEKPSPEYLIKALNKI